VTAKKTAAWSIIPNPVGDPLSVTRTELYGPMTLIISESTTEKVIGFARMKNRSAWNAEI